MIWGYHYFRKHPCVVFCGTAPCLFVKEVERFVKILNNINITTICVSFGCILTSFLLTSIPIHYNPLTIHYPGFSAPSF